MGRGGPQGVRMFLQGSGTSGTTFWLGDLGNFGGNGEEGRGHTKKVSETDHEEASAINRRWDIGDAQGGSSTGSGRNSVGDDLHR